MTVFAATDLPSTINSVEKLEVWATTVLQHLYSSMTVIESTGNAELAVSAAPFFITASDPDVWRYITRTSIALNSNWQRGAGKIWTHALDLGNSAIPTEFKS
jgi:hypothetical protein